jgi:hypothetical protein
MKEVRVKKIYYLGKDLNYWKNIQALIRHHYPEDSENQLIFASFEDLSQEKIQDFFKLCVKKRPDILYLDYSINTLEVFNLSKLLTECNSTRKIAIIALIDYLKKKEILPLPYLAGIKFTHIKGVELFDAVYNAFTTAFPIEVDEPDFARASLRDKVFVYSDYQVLSVRKDQLIIEGDLSLEEDTIYKFNWPISSDFLPSTSFKVINCRPHGMHLNFNYHIELAPVYASAMNERDFNKVNLKFSEPYSDKRINLLAEVESASLDEENEVSSALVLAITRSKTKKTWQK